VCPRQRGTQEEREYERQSQSSTHGFSFLHSTDVVHGFLTGD
jgi:hypothetical protein